MVTKERAMAGCEFHANGCSRVVGVRGGVSERVAQYRAVGACKTWKREPERFSVPLRYGVSLYSTYLTQDTADEYHAPEECPLLRTKGAVDGTRKGGR